MKRNEDLLNIDITNFQSSRFDMFSSIMTQELQNEIDHMIAEQKNYQNEILQLKKERDFLFQLLDKRQKEECKKMKKIKSKKENQIQSRKNKNFSFFNQVQISIQPKPNQNNIELDKNLICQITSKKEKKGRFTFSKDSMIQEIRKYQNPIFIRAASILERSKNGDSMVTFLVNTTGNALDSLDEEISSLKDEITKLKRKKRKIMFGSIETLTKAQTEEIKLRSALANSTKFYENMFDNF
ncbi:hypothetical protein TRFO_09587 [Tritrichomonas foetus]|uniref:Uncharacterized protein n=1 Tax=Tritrichomonas foetus TaxID=1144522 RepID=A0A1J4JG59_9EUKA|nr:hypothetical protein TRFO_09587 [Tritrichomonas foetus]|eukprot:OHS97295.1 hypothetical protein TRFO_09587 [Tritrichomonas foetus]